MKLPGIVITRNNYGQLWPCNCYFILQAKWLFEYICLFIIWTLFFITFFKFFKIYFLFSEKILNAVHFAKIATIIDKYKHMQRKTWFTTSIFGIHFDQSNSPDNHHLIWLQVQMKTIQNNIKENSSNCDKSKARITQIAMIYRN